MVRIVCTTNLFTFITNKIFKLNSKHLQFNYSHPVNKIQNQKFENKNFSGNNSFLYFFLIK